jgi:putative membrane protein
MSFLFKLAVKAVLNGAALYFATIYLPGFSLSGGLQNLVLGAIVLTLLNAFIRPILRLISAPLVWITFGLFNFVINMAILWIADYLLIQLTVADLWTLFLASLIVAVANVFI